MTILFSFFLGGEGVGFQRRKGVVKINDKERVINDEANGSILLYILV